MSMCVCARIDADGRRHGDRVPLSVSPGNHLQKAIALSHFGNGAHVNVSSIMKQSLASS